MLKKPNKIYAHIGPMFASKTSELHRLLNWQLQAEERVALFQPSFDTRVPHGQQPADHDGISRFEGQTYVVHDSADLLVQAERLGLTVIGIDEGQFLDVGLVPAIYHLFARSAVVYYAGLDTDFLGKPFETTRELIAHPEVKVFRWRAICVICRGSATRTLKIIQDRVATKYEDTPRHEVGDRDCYKPACFGCFTRAQRGELESAELERLCAPIVKRLRQRET